MRKHHLLGVVICAATLAIYWQARNFQFIDFDDLGYVVNNPHVLGGLNRDNIRWAFTDFHLANWHPLTWMSLMLDATLHRKPAIGAASPVDAGGFHLTNVLLHVACAWILFQTVYGMTDAPWPSVFVAGLFALHPLHVESVAWVAERKDVLSTFFGFLAIGAYGRFVRNHAPRWRWITLALFTCSLLAKQMFVTLPFFFLLLDYWPLRRFDARFADADDARRPFGRLLFEKIPFFGMAFLFCVVVYFAQREGGAVRAVEKYPLDVRVANAVVAYAEYLARMLWPTRLCFYYPHPGNTLPWWKVAVSAGVLLATTVGVLRWSRREKYLPVGWFWYLGTLVPVIGLVQVGDQAKADRYTYLPLVGPFLMIAWGLASLMDRLPWSARTKDHAYAAIVTIVLSVLSLLTYRQVGTWRDSETLFRHAVTVHPNNHFAYSKLGEIYHKAFRLGEAEQAYRASIRIKPEFAEAQGNILVVLTQAGKVAEAVRIYQEAPATVRDEPVMANNIAWILATSPEPSLRNGKLAVERARHACAMTQYREPGHLDSLAAALAEVGDFDEAARMIDLALSLLKPDVSPGIIAEMHQRRESFLSRRPWRDPPSTRTD